MAFSAQAKAQFYYELHRYVHSGMEIPRTLEAMHAEGRCRSMRSALQGMISDLQKGDSLERSMRNQPSVFGEMECGVVGAAEMSGRLESAFEFLARYFETFAATHRKIRSGLAYPAFLVHFAAVVLPLPRLVSGGAAAYLPQVIAMLAAVYGVGVTLFGGWWLLSRLSETEPTVDSVTQSIPLLGWVRRDFIFARFCAALEMLLNAGVGIPESLRRAGAASRSAAIAAAVTKALPGIETGQPVDAALASSGVFPEPLVRGIRVGLDTGTFDQEMERWSRFFWSRALDGVEAVSKWVPRIIYLLVVVGVGVQIVLTFSNMMNQVNKVIGE